MASAFPTELPERPLRARKLSLKLLSRKLAFSAINPVRPLERSMSTLSEDRNWNMSSDAASHHVLTQDTAPVTQRRESELQAVSPSRGLVSRFKSLASKAEVEHRPPSHNLEPFWDEAIAQQDFIVPRKPVPSRIDRAITDPLIETSEKLRLPQNRQSQPRSFAPAVPVLSPHLTPALSTPPPHSMDNFARLSMTNTNEPPRAAGEDAVMNEQLGNGFFRRRTSPKTKPAHTAIDVNSEDDFEAIQVKPKVPLQSRTQARKRASSPPRPLGSPAGAWSKKMRCYRGIDSSDSDEILTPSSSEDVEYPALTMPSPRQDEKDRRRSSQRVRGMERFLDSADAAQLQEHLDYNFALRLQQGEEKVYQSFYSQLRAAASQPATRRHDEEVPTRLFKGTREDPIDLNLDSDHDAVEPMDLDPDDWDRSPSSDADRTERYLDAQFARLIREEEGVQSAAVALRACAVCGDDHPISELPSLADCKHPPRTCAVCYSNWVTVQLQSNGWSEAKCPENQCKIKLSYYEVQHIATPDIFQQYDTYITRAAISEDPNFRWCRSCDSGQIHVSGEEGNIFTCASCHQKACIVHESTWHEGETCDEYEYRSSGRQERDQDDQEAASLAAIGKLSKKCPGPNCVYNIEKNDGCDHMTCSKCRYEFCWICLGDYRKIRAEGNAAHAVTCNWHTERLPN